MVTHRCAVWPDFDQIIVMDDGRIIERRALMQGVSRTRALLSDLSNVCKLLLNDPTCVLEFRRHASGSAFPTFYRLPSPEGRGAET